MLYQLKLNGNDKGVISSDNTSIAYHWRKYCQVIQYDTDTLYPPTKEGFVKYLNSKGIVAEKHSLVIVYAEY